MNEKQAVSAAGIIANVLLAAGKISVGIISRSAAIAADGINSATDVVASVMNYIGVKVAEKPADDTHPYGHGKAEVIAGFLITIIIFLSGVWIFYDAIHGFFMRESPEIGSLSLMVMAVSASVNYLMSRLKIYYGKKNDSISLVSDGVHSRIDVLVSLVIFGGLFLVPYFNSIDSLLACLAGLYIIRESLRLGREATDSLLGSSAGEAIEQQIREVIASESLSLDGLKTQKIGQRIFAEVSVRLPSQLKVEEADAIRRRVEEHLTTAIPRLEYVSITIASHHIATGYFNPPAGLGKSFGWGSKGRMVGTINKAHGAGPRGMCRCPSCGFETSHVRGVPCSTVRCPRCGAFMGRGREHGSKQEQNSTQKRGDAR